MPGRKFSFAPSAQSQQLAAAASGVGIPVPDVTPAPETNDILALLGQGGMDPQMLMALLSLLAGMGPQGAPGQTPPGMEQPQGPIETAYGA